MEAFHNCIPVTAAVQSKNKSICHTEQRLLTRSSLLGIACTAYDRPCKCTNYNKIHYIYTWQRLSSTVSVSLQLPGHNLHCTAHDKYKCMWLILLSVVISALYNWQKQCPQHFHGMQYLLWKIVDSPNNYWPQNGLENPTSTAQTV